MYSQVKKKMLLQAEIKPTSPRLLLRVNDHYNATTWHWNVATYMWQILFYKQELTELTGGDIYINFVIS